MLVVALMVVGDADMIHTRIVTYSMLRGNIVTRMALDQSRFVAMGKRSKGVQPTANFTGREDDGPAGPEMPLYYMVTANQSQGLRFWHFYPHDGRFFPQVLPPSKLAREYVSYTWNDAR